MTTDPETDVAAADFAGYARGIDRNLGSELKHRHHRAPFMAGTPLFGATSQ
jgi:hypothetical protein